MANDSSTGGYLQPAAPTPPIEDASLDSIFQQMVVGLTGLPGAMVRPRWQPTVPKQPEPATNWCAMGVTQIEQEPGTAALIHSGAGNGSDTMYRNEKITLLASFYGTNGMQYAAMVRDGLYVEQNNGMLGQNLMGLVGVGTMRAAPELINQQWIRRYDIEIVVRRQVVRTYAVLNLQTAQATLYDEAVTTSITVHP